MLQQLHLRQFKSFKDQEIELSPLTICVGANASGKSNLFDAIRFLQGIGSGMVIRDIFQGVWKGGREVWTGIRGGANEAAFGECSLFELECTWNPRANSAMNYQIGCQTLPNPRLCRESLKVEGSGKYIFDTHAGALGGQTGFNDGGGIRVAVRREGRGNSPTATYPANRSLMEQIGPMEGMHHLVLPIIGRYQEILEASYFLDITPGRMRDYVPKQVDQLGAEGENLSGIIWNMAKQGAQPEREDIIDWLSELCSQEFAGLSFVETDLGDVMLEVVEESGHHISARSLSDGTLRFLGLIAALLTAPSGSMLLLEEIENGLHPSRVHLLVELLEEITAVRDIQVIATTHSPRVLSSLSRDNLDNAVLFARQNKDSKTAGTMMRRFCDIPHFEEVLEKKSIEDLYVSRWLENALWMS